jgi:hypothetical protein
LCQLRDRLAFAHLHHGITAWGQHALNFFLCLLAHGVKKVLRLAAIAQEKIIWHHVHEHAWHAHVFGNASSMLNDRAGYSGQINACDDCFGMSAHE